MFGADFLIDDESNVYFLEINSNPSFYVKTSFHNVLIPYLRYRFLDLTTEVLR